MLLVVITPTWGTLRMKYSMIGNAVATIPEGTVNGPEMVLPRKPVVKKGGLVEVVMLGCEFYLLAHGATIRFE